VKYAYFPGCSLHATAKEYDTSTQAVCKVLGIELIELEDWNCCGATAAYAVDRLLSVVWPARDLAIAEREKMDIFAPCAGCFHYLARANEMLKDKPELREKANKVLGTIGFEYKGMIEVWHPLDIIVNDIGLEEIRKKVVRPLNGLKVATYYGCLLVKPPNITKFENPENPQTLDKLSAALGATCVPWGRWKTRCCGGALQMVKEDIMLELSKQILTAAESYGADCIVTACPFCHFNLDVKQSDINSIYGTKIKIPILYFTQLLGLALGIEPKELGLDKIIVPATKIVKAIST
jgi:heterodisulfide reductase subunit B